MAGPRIARFPSRRLPSYPPFADSARRRGGFAAAAFRRLTSPAMAFLVSFPTIGYYTFAAYVNVLAPEGSIGAIIVRAVCLAILVLAWLLVPRGQRRRFGGLLLPATIFLLFYACRLLQNMLFLDIEIQPGNVTVLLTFFISGLIPAFLLASMERGIRDEDMIFLLSVFAILFVIGMGLNRELLMETAERRMALDKINPIALAYVASSFMMFYLLAFARSKRIKVEALAVVPIMLLIVSLARSRGMMISTGATLLVYVLMLKGSRRLRVLSGLAAAAAAIGYYANPEYLGSAIDALSRIDVNTDMSTAGRVLLFEGAWRQFINDPLLGRYAAEVSSGYYYPHNIYLESLMAVGLIGIIPFAIHLFLAGRAAIGILRERERSFTRVFVALLFIRDAIGAAASGSLWGASGFWVTSFLVIVMWYGRKQDERCLNVHWRRRGARNYPPPCQRVESLNPCWYGS